ncbi:MAG: thioredoxin fold domain-containing protein [bacterium]|nr:thioredoxin fold domain-containing protein [bacterium]
MANVMEFNVANFATEVTGSDVPVLVDFWAPWCGPARCWARRSSSWRASSPARRRSAKVNVDDNQDLAAQFGIRGIPTVLLFKGGKQVGSFVGLKPKEELAKALTDAM